MNTRSILKIVVVAGLLGMASMSLAAEDTWTYKTDMPTARTWVSGCVLDGKIYVIGGSLNQSSSTSAVEMYDPIVDTWTTMANMPSARSAHATCTFGGKIYVFGGISPGVYSTAKKNVYVYDPQIDTWTQKADIPYANAFCGIAVVDGTIYLIGGGLSITSPPIPTVMAYNPITESWTQKADMLTARFLLSASIVDGKIYAVGGSTENWTVFCYKHVEVYDPSTNTWTRKSDMPTERVSLGTCVADGKIYATGGYLPNRACTANEVYDPITDTWTTKSPMQQKRLGHFVGLVGDKIYAIGGSYPNPQPTHISTTEEYDTGLGVPSPNLNADDIVDFKDLSILFEYWLQNEWSVDISPPPFGDGMVDFKDLAVLAEHWHEEILYIKWLAHASVKIWSGDTVVYVDPRNLSESPHDATLVLVTHTHGDHYQPASIARVSNSQTQFIAPPDVVQQYGSGQAIAPGQTIESSGVPVTGVRSYNTNKPNHPKSNNWVGFIIELGGKRTYVAGDTDLIPEMQTLGKIDVAFLPAGGTYTMNATEAAQAATIINPILAIPYHWGTSVGTLADAQTFAQKAKCAVKILAAGETISSDNWPEYSPLIAHWKLDEIEGNIAGDSADDHDGTLHGNPDWQPTGGNKDGSLQFDGVNDYISTDFVLNPADGAFSVCTWIKCDTPGQAVISQTDGTGTGATWLGTESPQGKLMTGLVSPPTGRFPTPPLVSEFVITNGQWHHIGLVWDGSQRHLYADGTEVAKDAGTLAPLKSSDGGLHIGTGKDLDAASFWFGLIDDVRIYSVALSAEEVGELAL